MSSFSEGLICNFWRIENTVFIKQNITLINMYCDLVFILMQCTQLCHEWNWIRKPYWVMVMLFIATFNNITVIPWRSTILQLYRGGQQYYSYIVAVNNITAISWRSTILQLYRGRQQYYSYIVAVNNITVISWRSVLFVEETGENHHSAASHWRTLSHKVV
jgi:hypothetical protein